MSPERRRWVYCGLALAVLVVLAFLAGKYLAPVRVEEKVRVERVEVEKVVVQEKVRVETVTVEKKVEVLRRVFVERVAPDGTVERRTTEDLATSTDASSSSSGAAEKVAEAARVSRLDASTSKTVERYDPMWKLGLVGGVSASSSAPAAVGGIQGGVRLGPVWVSAQLQTDARTRVDILAGLALEL